MSLECVSFFVPAFPHSSLDHPLANVSSLTLSPNLSPSAHWRMLVQSASSPTPNHAPLLYRLTFYAPIYLTQPTCLRIHFTSPNSASFLFDTDGIELRYYQQPNPAILIFKGGLLTEDCILNDKSSKVSRISCGCGNLVSLRSGNQTEFARNLYRSIPV